MAINLYGYSTNRISGLYSGMDTQSLVNNMMALEQLKVDKIYQQREKAIWKNEAYTAINTAVSNLRNSFLSALGENSMVKNSTYNNFTVNMAASSAIKITATDSAIANSFSITSIKAATAASVTAPANTRGTALAGPSNMFSQASTQTRVEIYRELEDSTFERMTEDSTIEDFAGRFGLTKPDQQLSFSINGETFSFTQDQKISDVLAKVNGEDPEAPNKANVTMTFEDGKFSLKSNTIGATSAQNAEGTNTRLSLKDISGTAFGGDKKGFGLSPVKSESVINDDTTIGDLKAMGFEINDNSLTVNGETIDFDDTTKVSELMTKINAEGVDLKYNEQLGSFRMTSDDPTKAISLSGSFFKATMNVDKKDSYAGTDPIKRSDTLLEAANKMGKEIDERLKINVNGVDFEFNTKTTSLNQMMTTINNNADAKAVFSFSEMTDTFSITSLDTGAESRISVTGLEAFFGSNNEARGTDAVIKLADGNEIVQGSNTFTLDGMKFEVLGDFEAVGANENINVNVTRDNSATVNAVKSFVEEYNSLLDQLNSLYTGKVNRDYPPLTETQRAELSEKEIENWDTMAKSGILRNDPAIGSLLSNLRSSIFAKVEGTGLSAADLGISTIGWNDMKDWKTDQGKLTLNEDKLLAALEKNPNAVQDVFTKISYASNGSVDTSIDNTGTTRSGLFTRMSEFFSGFNTTMRNQNIKTSQKSVDDYTNKISDMLSKMAEKEEKYWLKYAQLETALSKLQSQQDWMSQQLGMATK